MRHLLSALSLLLVALFVSPAAPATAAPTASTAPTTIYWAVLDDIGSRVAGRPADLTAVLGSGDNAVVGQQLTLWLRPYGATAFIEAGHATTDASGSATVWVTLVRNATAHWTYGGSGEYDASTSPDHTVQVSPRVTRSVNDRTLRRGQRLVVKGRTYPAKAGCTVKLWRGELRPLVSGPAPVRLATSTVRADGSYRLVKRFHQKARMRIAVTVSPCAGNARGLSAYARITVR